MVVKSLRDYRTRRWDTPFCYRYGYLRVFGGEASSGVLISCQGLRLRPGLRFASGLRSGRYQVILITEADTYTAPFLKTGKALDGW